MIFFGGDDYLGYFFYFSLTKSFRGKICCPLSLSTTLILSSCSVVHILFIVKSLNSTVSVSKIKVVEPVLNTVRDAMLLHCSYVGFNIVSVLHVKYKLHLSNYLIIINVFFLLQININDFVAVKPQDSHIAVYIARVAYMWETGSGQKMFHAHWFW